MKKAKSLSQRRPVELPPQDSATDTTNWEKRNVSAPTLDKISKKPIVRDVEFLKNEIKFSGFSTAQVQSPEAQKGTKKPPK